MPKIVNYIKYYNHFIHSFESRTLNDSYYNRAKGVLEKLIQQQTIEEIFEPLLGYTEYERFGYDEGEFVIAFIFKYDLENKPYVKDLYEIERDNLAKNLGEHGIWEALLYEEYENFSDFYLEYGMKNLERFKKLHDVYEELSFSHGIEEMDNIKKIILSERWYTISDEKYNVIVDFIKKCNYDISPKEINELLK